MCLVRVVIDDPASSQEPIRDVVDVRTEVRGVKVATLFGEEFAFDGFSIARVDLSANIIHLTGGLPYARA